MIGIPKTKRYEDRHLLDMARGKPCLFRWVHGCRGEEGSTTVAAHENSLMGGGKGMRRKADDHRSVWACAWCHAVYDEGYSKSHAEKVEAFNVAMQRQLLEWWAIAASPTAKAKDKASAKAALDLNNFKAPESV